MQAMPVILCMSTNMIDMWTGLVIYIYLFNGQGNLIYEAYYQGAYEIVNLSQADVRRTYEQCIYHIEFLALGRV